MPYFPKEISESFVQDNVIYPLKQWETNLRNEAETKAASCDTTLYALNRYSEHPILKIIMDAVKHRVYLSEGKEDIGYEARIGRTIQTYMRRNLSTMGFGTTLLCTKVDEHDEV